MTNQFSNNMGASLLHGLCEKYASLMGADPYLVHWMKTVSDCIAGDPTGDKVSPFEPTEEEWATAASNIDWMGHGPMGLAAVSAEAHRLAGVRRTEMSNVNHKENQ